MKPHFFFFNIEMKRIEHKINHFKMSNPVILTTVAALYSHHVYLEQCRFHSTKMETLDPLSICFSFFSPPCPVTFNLCSISMDLPIQIFQINGIIPYVTICVRLFAFSLIFSRFIHIIVRIHTSFLVMAESFSVVWMYHSCSSVQPLMDCWASFGLS